MPYKVVSFFSGCGGSSYGYKLAGLDVISANEFIPAAIDTYKANFPTTRLIEGDIRKVSVADVLKATGLKVGELDVLDGSPPCFIAGTLINTKRGFLPIEEVVVGDKVLTHKNRYQKVTSTMNKKYSGNLHEIGCSGAEKVFCTSEHPFYIKERLNKKSWQKLNLSNAKWVDAKDVTTKDYLSVAIPTEELSYKWSGVVSGDAFNRTTRKFEKFETLNNLPIDNEDFWWLVGRWLGDGWCRYYENNPEVSKKTKSNRYIFVICCNKKNAETKEITEVLTRLNFSYSVKEHKTVNRISINSRELVTFIRRFGTSGYNKFIPKDVQELSIKLQKSLLVGYYSADGYEESKKNGNSFKYSSSSRQLVYGLNILAMRVYKNSNGQIIGRIPKRDYCVIEGRKCNLNPSWSHEVKDYKTDRQHSFVDNNNILWTKCKVANKSDWSGTVYNISVEEDESYTANNIIVHNCGSFSMAGLREEKWGKIATYSDSEQRTDDLFDEYVRMVKGIQPKVFVAENVAGMAMGGAKPYFAKIYRDLENCGYNVSCRLLNAQYFNVPQHRPRLIWIGVRKDLNVLPSHPKPQYAPITLGEALKGVVNTPEEILESEYKKHYSVIPLLNQMKPGESGDKYHPNGSYFSLRRLDFTKVCCTILQKDATHTSCSAVHPIDNRKLTIPELRRVCSFPDSFIFTGNYGKQWERMGRAVPPLFMKAIAEHVRYAILDKINGITNTYNPPVYDSINEDDQLGLITDSDMNSFKEIKPEPIKEQWKEVPLV